LFVSTFSVFTSINLLTDTGFVKQSLVRDGVYETQLKRALSNSITRSVDSWKNYHEYSTGESFDLEIDTKRLSDAMERSIPMDLIEAETGRAIEEILNYLKRDQEKFDLSVDMTTIIESTFLNLVDTLYRENTVDLDTISILVTNSLIDLSSVEGNIGADTTDIIADSISNEWLKNQIIEAIPEIVPYFVGQADIFNITVNLDGVFGERSTIYIDGVDNETLGYWYKHISDLLVESYIERSIVEPVEIEFLGGSSISVSVDELRYIVNETIASEDLDALINRQSLDGLALYFMGYSDEFELSMDLEKISSAAVDPTLDIIKAKLLSSTDQDPIANSIQQGILTVLLDQYRDPIETIISDLISRDSVFNEDDLIVELSRTHEGMEILRSMENLRALLKEGFVYTDKDFQSQLGHDGAGRFNQLRDSLKTASTYDEKDLSHHLMEYANFDNTQIEGFRDILSNNTNRVLVMQLLSLISLVIIGFLVARDYINKLRAILLTVCMASLVLLGVVISADSVLSNSIISLITELENQIALQDYEGNLADLFVSNIVAEYTISSIHIIDNFRIILVDDIKGFVVPCLVFTLTVFIISHLFTGLTKLKKSA